MTSAYLTPSLPFLILTVTLAAARITHLITTDTIATPLRDRLAPHPFFDELVNCPWCIGFWVALTATIVALFLPPPITFVLALPWAMSYIVGFLEGLTP